MNDAKSDIRRIIQELAGQRQPVTLICKVTSVNESKCEVEPLDGALLKDVRLNASVDQFNGLRITPKKDSYVLVTMLSETDAFVSMYSDIDKIEFDGAGGIKVEIKDDHISLKNDKTSLKDEVDDLLDTLINAKIATPAGLGLFNGDVITKLTQIKTNLNNLLED